MKRDDKKASKKLSLERTTIGNLTNVNTLPQGDDSVTAITRRPSECDTMGATR